MCVFRARIGVHGKRTGPRRRSGHCARRMPGRIRSKFRAVHACIHLVLDGGWVGGGLGCGGCEDGGARNVVLE